MAKKITRKNFTWRSAAVSDVLFYSFIVAAGVCVRFPASGHSEPSMKITGDAYFDKSDLMDIKAVSTLGINGR